MLSYGVYLIIMQFCSSTVLQLSSVTEVGDICWLNFTLPEEPTGFLKDMAETHLTIFKMSSLLISSTPPIMSSRARSLSSSWEEPQKILEGTKGTVAIASFGHDNSVHL